MIGVVGGLASGRVLFAASLLLAVLVVMLVEGYYNVVFVGVGTRAAELGVEGAYVAGLASALAALVAGVVLFGSRETALALRFYSGSFTRCVLVAASGSALYGLGFAVLLFLALAGGSGDARGSLAVALAGFADYLVLSLVFYGLTAGVSEARLVAAVLVFIRAFTPPIEGAWLASPELAAHSYLAGRLAAWGLAAYMAVYAALGALACRALAWRG